MTKLMALKTDLPDAAIAAEAGVSLEAVRLWRHGKRRIAPAHVSAVSRITGIPRHELRPDLWEPPADTVPAPEAAA